MGVKNCPETPRQKMINMMYLVLTALLALNVAAETLYAFKVVDISLMRTFDSFSRKNASVMSDFDWQVEKGQKQEVAKHYREKAMEVHNSSDEIISFITEVKTRLAKEADAQALVPGERVPDEFPYIVTNQNDTLILERQDDLNISPQIMIEEGKGEELRTQIKDYKSKIHSIANSDSTLSKLLDSVFFNNLDKILDVSDPAKRDVSTDAKTWVQQNFDRTPLIACITMLSKTQSDIRFAENLIINTIYSAIKGDSYFEAKVIPKSTYILSGVQKFETDIFLSAITNVPEAEVYINGSSTPLKMDNGRAVYSVAPNTPGKYTYTGEIRYRSPEGYLINAPFKGEYEVAPPSAISSALKMNVLYRGIDNPVGISAPGLSSNSLRPIINNGTISQNGSEWTVRPATLSNTRIDIYASIDGREVLMGTSEFRVRDVPPPEPSFGGFTSGASIPRDFLQQGTVKELNAVLKDFLFDLEFEVTSFEVSIPTGGGITAPFSSNSKNFTSALTNTLSQVPNGSYIRFENVKAKIKGSNNAPVTIKPAIFYVRN
jgi:gliding motility-associated protein GldM